MLDLTRGGYKQTIHAALRRVQAMRGAEVTGRFPLSFSWQQCAGRLNAASYRLGCPAARARFRLGALP
jgi:hypothetical protein